MARAAWFLLLFLLPACGGEGTVRLPPSPPGTGRPAKHVILFVGDGMGEAQAAAAGIFLHGAAGTLGFQSFPEGGRVSTLNAEGGVTDSAAAATAMATGRKASNGVLSMAIPGDGSPLDTALERMARGGKATGLVTTAELADATPGAFGAHRASREDRDGVVRDYLWGSRPDVLFGGSAYLAEGLAAAAGYAVVTDCASLAALDKGSAGKVAGLFGRGEMPYYLDGTGNLPRLFEMTREALALLGRDPDGLFLLVEGGLVDHACHENDLARMVPEVDELDRAVAEAVAWASGREDVLIVVTGDHETGGLSVLGGGGEGVLPSVAWGTGGHTAAPVPYHALGDGAGRAGPLSENTDVYRLLLGIAPP